MNRKQFLRLSVATVLTLISKGRFRANMTNPNVILFYVDDMPRWMLDVVTGIREAFSGGREFSRAYTTTPVCAPSRASVLSGKYTHNHKIFDNPTAADDFRPQSRDSIAARLEEVGYSNMLAGKWMNGNSSPTWVAPGFRKESNRSHEWVMFTGLNKEPGYFEVNFNGDLRNIDRDRISEEAYIRNRSNSFIRDCTTAGRPFFLYYATHHPHGPYFPDPKNRGFFKDYIRDPMPPNWMPDNDDERKEITQVTRGKLEELLDVADSLKSFFQTLNELGILDNTVVMFATDNGYFLGEHGLMHKGLAYEEGVNSPFFIKGFGVPEGIDSDHLIGTPDITATIADLAGARRDEFDGRSFKEIMYGSGEWKKRQFLIHPNRDWTAVREGAWIFIDNLREGDQLYNLDTDPYELNNLADQHQDDVQVFRDRISRFKNSHGETLRQEEISV